jgi:hypothetical protein
VFRACTSPEQPRILDGDSGLVGEGFDQFDLRVGDEIVKINIRG